MAPKAKQKPSRKKTRAPRWPRSAFHIIIRSLIRQ